MPPLIIGYGNPLRGDDGLGWHVVQALAEVLPPGAATVLACHQLTPELAEPIAQASLLVLVDARIGAQPGRIAVETVEPVGVAGWSFSHHLTPESLLQMAEQLYGRRPATHVISVEAADLDDRLTLSDEVAGAVPDVVARIERLVGSSSALPG